MSNAAVESVIQRVSTPSHFSGAGPLDRTDVSRAAYGGFEAGLAEGDYPLITEIADMFGVELIQDEVSEAWAETEGVQDELRAAAEAMYPGVPPKLARFLFTQQIEQGGEWLDDRFSKVVLGRAAVLLCTGFRPKTARSLWQSIAGYNGPISPDKAELVIPEQVRAAEISDTAGKLELLKHHIAESVKPVEIKE